MGKTVTQGVLLDLDLVAMSRPRRPLFLWALALLSESSLILPVHR